MGIASRTIYHNLIQGYDPHCRICHRRAAFFGSSSTYRTPSPARTAYYYGERSSSSYNSDSGYSSDDAPRAHKRARQGTNPRSEKRKVHTRSTTRSQSPLPTSQFSQWRQDLLEAERTTEDSLLFPPVAEQALSASRPSQIAEWRDTKHTIVRHQPEPILKQLSCEDITQPIAVRAVPSIPTLVPTRATSPVRLPVTTPNASLKPASIEELPQPLTQSVHTPPTSSPEQILPLSTPPSPSPARPIFTPASSSILVPVPDLFEDEGRSVSVPDVPIAPTAIPSSIPISTVATPPAAIPIYTRATSPISIPNSSPLKSPSSSLHSRTSLTGRLSASFPQSWHSCLRSKKLRNSGTSHLTEYGSAVLGIPSNTVDSNFSVVIEYRAPLLSLREKVKKAASKFARAPLDTNCELSFIINHLHAQEAGLEIKRYTGSNLQAFGSPPDDDGIVPVGAADLEFKIVGSRTDKWTKVEATVVQNESDGCISGLPLILKLGILKVNREFFAANYPFDQLQSHLPMEEDL